MATDAQISANQQNSRHSTGPKSESGKAASCQNNFKYGLTGASFTVLDFEDQDEYDHLLCGLRFEHQPSTMTETILVEKMAQSYWLRKRALYLQDITMAEDLPLRDQESRLEEPAGLSEAKTKAMALFIRYQTTHDRAFHTALNSLLKLRAEKRRSEIGFGSQKRHEADQSRRDSAEKRKQDLHQFAVLLAEAKVDHQFVLTSNAKLDGIIAATRENIPLEARKAA